MFTRRTHLSRLVAEASTALKQANHSSLNTLEQKQQFEQAVGKANMVIDNPRVNAKQCDVTQQIAEQALTKACDQSLSQADRIYYLSVAISFADKILQNPNKTNEKQKSVAQNIDLFFNMLKTAQSLDKPVSTEFISPSLLGRNLDSAQLGKLLEIYDLQCAALNSFEFNK